ncbi:MAG TPA: cation:proton antiporter [Candidatus Binatia bacterium]|jgi:Kef-type K+ transport system membrane component KefB|nr:cation:proton antiporter [Candidatus Binatia bacterium]
MAEAHSFAPLLVVVMLAFLVPLVLSSVGGRLAIPIVVGEIVAGMIVGRSGFGWVLPDNGALSLLKELGFVLLMFLSGMEIDFRSLRGIEPQQARHQSPWSPPSLAVLNFGATLVLAGAFAWGLKWIGATTDPWMMGLILSTTALGVVVPILKEAGLSQSLFGQSILLATVIADFVTMFLISVQVAIVSRGLTAEILLVFLLFVAFFLAARFGSFLSRIESLQRVIQELSHATAQIKVRAAFSTLLIFVVLAEKLGIEIIVGAFLAGAIVSLLRTPEDRGLSSQFEAIGFGFFIPIFFIMIGVDFNLPALLSSTGALLSVPLLLIAAITVKVIPGFVFRLNHTWREALAAGILMCPRLSLIIAAAAIGEKLGVIDESVNAGIVLVAIVTVTASPLAFLKVFPAPRAKVARSIVDDTELAAP